jgi:hypothetical protein
MFILLEYLTSKGSTCHPNLLYCSWQGASAKVMKATSVTIHTWRKAWPSRLPTVAGL